MIIGDDIEDANGYGTMKPKNLISSILGGTPAKAKTPVISNPHDFRQVKTLRAYGTYSKEILSCFYIAN